MRMRLRAGTFIRVMMAGLAVMMICLILADAYAQTNNAPASTNSTPASTNRFSQRLVDSFKIFDEGLIDKHRSELSFGLDQIEILQIPILHKPLWQYIASGIYLLIAFYLSRLVDWFAKNRLTQWVKRTGTKWDDVLIHLAHGPVKMLVLVMLFHLGLEVFDWPVWLETWLSRLAFLLLAVSLVMVVLRAVDATIAIWRGNLKPGGDQAFDDQFLVLVGKLLKVAIALVALLMLLDNLHVNITALLGSVSVLGLALGLAAQDTVSNLFGAIAVFVDKPFRVGDVIKVGDIQGAVEEMGLRAARVRTVDGFLVTIPNKTIGANTVTNISRRGAIRLSHSIGLPYETPVPRIKQAIGLIEKVYGDHPLTQDLVVTFNQFGASNLNIEIVWVCKTIEYKTYTRALQEINLAVKERFDAEKVEFSQGSQTIVCLPPAAGLSPG